MKDSEPANYANKIVSWLVNAENKALADLIKSELERVRVPYSCFGKDTSK